ncbi:hypothetical protein PENTCL1PPCAC_19376, partial [Pristionchus entomophagus]
ELQPLSARPELFMRNDFGVTYTQMQPRVLLSSDSSFQNSREITINVDGVTGAASSELHYAGNGKIEDAMYYYTKKAGLIFEPGYLLIKMELLVPMYRIGDTPSANVTFFHRQPYYLLRTGMFTTSWKITHFDHVQNSKSVDLKGICLNDALFIYKEEKMFIFRQGTKERSEVNDNVVIIQHPWLDMNCTAYADDWDPIIYIAFSTEPQLMVVNAETLAIDTVLLPSILDIRHATSGQLIFNCDTPEGSALRVGQLDLKYWMPKEMLQMQLNKTTKVLETVRLREETALKGLMKEIDELAKKDVVKENQELRARIDQLTNILAMVKMNEEMEKKKSENQNRKGNTEQLLRMKKKVHDKASENELEAIRKERDLLAARNAELEAKYRKALLLLGREKEVEALPFNSSEATHPAAENDQKAASGDDPILPEPNQTKKKRKRNKKNTTVTE